MNADDLGLSDGVNAGVFEAHVSGVVTSASLMVLRPAAAAAAEEARRHPDLSLGLHLDLDDIQRDTDMIGFACRRQLESFRALTGQNPTHVDSHHHVHMCEPVTAAACEFADELGVPLRGRGIRYEGGFFGRCEGRQTLGLIAPEHLITLIGSLPPGWTELGCHPGRGVGRVSSYADERELELRSLCDPRIAAAISEYRIELCSFADVPKGSGLPPDRSLDSGVDGGA